MTNIDLTHEINSTYRQDYVLPSSRGYGFVEALLREIRGEKPPMRICTPPPSPYKLPLDSVDFFAKNAEWTAVAPMGRLLEPAIIPNTLTDEQKEIIATEDRAPDECMVGVIKETPHQNPHVEEFRTVFPELFERLRVPPRDPRLRRPLKNVDLSTYQYEFCFLNSFPDDGDPLPKRRKKKPPPEDELPPCDENRMESLDALAKLENQEEEEEEDELELLEKRSYQPMLTFADSIHFVNCGNGLAWPKRIFTRRGPDYSEYMDTINKNGCVIMRNDLHTHTMCGKDSRFCKHPIIHKCKRLK